MEEGDGGVVDNERGEGILRNIFLARRLTLLKDGGCVWRDHVCCCFVSNPFFSVNIFSFSQNVWEGFRKADLRAGALVVPMMEGHVARGFEGRTSDRKVSCVVTENPNPLLPTLFRFEVSPFRSPRSASLQP